MIALQRSGRATRIAIFLYAVVAVALYACALPLWEGWDEPFHYGYVESLAVQQEIPVLNQATLSQEIADSLTLTPLPRFLAQAVHGSISFEDWHKLRPEQRAAMRTNLAELAPELRNQRGPNPNYEAQQTPLAYLLLAPFDAAVSRLQLLPRILALRLFEGAVAVVLLFLAITTLARALALTDIYRDALLFCALSIQVVWAAISHVGNDALAIPLTVWFFALLMQRRKLLPLAFIFAAGLLTKAYFLSFAPVFLIACLYRWRQGDAHGRRVAAALALVIAVAAPWYGRNLHLYGSFSGTQESVSGIGLRQALTAVPHIHWFRSLLIFFRSSLWTGDWSFVAYSRGTLAAEQILLLAGFVLYCSQVHRMRAGEWLLWTGCGCFGIGLFYQTCVTWVHTHGEATTPEPWYWQGVAVCLFALLFAGFERSPRLGQFFAAGMCAVSAWIAFSTFWVKMLPGYGGGIGRATVGVVAAWWTAHPARDLHDAALASPPIVFLLLICFTCLLLLVTAQLLTSFMAGRGETAD